MEAGRAEGGGVVRPTDPGLGHPEDALGHRSTDPDGPLVVDLEGDQVALVHADEGGARGGQAPLELGLVVDLEQHIDPELHGQGVEVAQLGVVEGGDDEEHGVGAHGPGVRHVTRVDREVLAEHRQRDRGPRRLEVGRGSAEVGTVGEHGQAGRAALGVGPSGLRGVEVGRQVALRRGPALHLGDHCQPVGGGGAQGGRAAAGGSAPCAPASAASSDRGSAAARSRCASRMRSR